MDTDALRLNTQEVFYAMTQDGRELGGCSCKTTALAPDHYRIEVAADEIPSQSRQVLTVEGPELAPRELTLQIARRLATGGAYREDAKVSWQGDVATVGWKVERSSWEEPVDVAGPAAVLPTTLVPVYYEWLIRRMEALHQDELTLWLPNQHTHAKAKMAARVAGEPIRITLDPDVEVHVWLGENGVERLEVPQQHVVVERSSTAPEVDLKPMPWTWPWMRRRIRPTEPPTDHRDEEVEVTAKDGAVLRGTLTRPLDCSEFCPAVLIVAGSGHVDRDGHVGNTFIYRDLADRLAQAGVVSLRYDKRGVGESEGGGATADDHFTTALEDAGCCLEVLLRAAEVDPGRVLALGHSEGGIHVLRLGQDQPLAGVITMAGPGWSLDHIVIEQFLYQLHLKGSSEAILAQARADLEEGMDKIRKGEEETFLGMPGDYLRAAMDIDPALLAKQLPCSLLVLQGTRDIEVLPGNAKRLVDAALSGGPKEVELKVLEGLNHLFTRPGYQGLGEDYQLPLPLDKEAVACIRDWVCQLQPRAGTAVKS